MAYSASMSGIIFLQSILMYSITNFLEIYLFYYKPSEFDLISILPNYQIFQ